MNGVIGVLDLIGGLGIFLIGMRWMSDGIQRRAGSRFRRVLHTMTNNRFAGVATGLGVTAVIQSSSATTVLLVSLVNAGLISLRQSIGVVMGANTGTTLTAWIVSLVGFQMKITNFALPDIRNNPDVLAFLQGWSDMGFFSIVLFILIGAVLTVVVQSSSAAMTITITMAFRGWISFPVAAAVVLGENIGTTVTAFLASLPMGSTAKRTARAHMIFNVIGVLWMLTVFYPFTRLADVIIPGSAADAANIPLHLSMFHTLFNVTNTALLIPFVGALTRLVEWMVPERVTIARTIASTQRIVNELESISDSCFGMGMLMEKLQRKGWQLHRAADEELYRYTAQVLQFLEYNGNLLAGADGEVDLDHALELEERINKVRNKLKKRSRRSLERDKEPDVKGELAFIDIVRHLEHIGDYSLNVSEAVAELS